MNQRLGLHPTAFLFGWMLLAGSATAAPPATPMQSQPSSNEIDTADQGGQIGGRQLGMGYRLKDLRCGSGEAMVGARIRRGDVLDHLQIYCATPRCDAQGCRWANDHPGPEAGGEGGDLGPLMRCDPDKVLSGLKGIVVRFTSFDYAADLEIECAGISGRPAAGLVPVGSNVRWHHGEGWLGMRSYPRTMRTEASPVLTCRDKGYGATAISVAEADFVRSRVVQAVSLYCPNQPARPSGGCAELGGSNLVSDRLLQDEQGSYNCHYYTKTFILGRRPSANPNPNTFLELAELKKLGYRLVGEATDPARLTGAKARDVLLVRGPSYKPLFPWDHAAELSVHSAIVTTTDGSGHITSTRQKPDAEGCIKDMNAAEVYRTYNRAEGTRYQVWRR